MHDRVNMPPKTKIFWLIFPLISLCYATKNNSSGGKPNCNMVSLSFPKTSQHCSYHHFVWFSPSLLFQKRMEKEIFPKKLSKTMISWPNTSILRKMNVLQGLFTRKIVVFLTAYKQSTCYFFSLFYTGHSPTSTIWTLCLWCSFWCTRDTRYSREPRTRGTHGHRRATRSSWFYGTTRGQGRRRKGGKPRPHR